MPYQVEIKNLLSQTVPDLGLFTYNVDTFESTLISVTLRPRETLTYVVETKAGVSDQMWNVVEQELITLRACGVLMPNRFRPWGAECISPDPDPDPDPDPEPPPM